MGKKFLMFRWTHVYFPFIIFISPKLVERKTNAVDKKQLN